MGQIRVTVTPTLLLLLLLLSFGLGNWEVILPYTYSVCRHISDVTKTISNLSHNLKVKHTLQFYARKIFNKDTIFYWCCARGFVSKDHMSRKSRAQSPNASFPYMICCKMCWETRQMSMIQRWIHDLILNLLLTVSLFTKEFVVTRNTTTTSIWHPFLQTCRDKFMWTI